MTGKIFRSTLAASLTVLLASLLVITGLSGPRPGHGGAADLGGIGRHSAV